MRVRSLGVSQRSATYANRLIGENDSLNVEVRSSTREEDPFKNIHPPFICSHIHRPINAPARPES